MKYFFKTQESMDEFFKFVGKDAGKAVKDQYLNHLVNEYRSMQDEKEEIDNQRFANTYDYSLETLK
jgi:hypothetical protein